MQRIASDQLSVDAPPGWEDVTDSVGGDEMPPTLGRWDGVGALQFSVAIYAKGAVPDPSPEDLSQMLASFADAKGLGAPRDRVVESGSLRLAAVSFDFGVDFLRVWQISDGRNFALVTYVCESGQEHRELEECERIVRSLPFT